MIHTSRILVVDDDRAIREFVELVLADEGYDVTTAEHGAQALQVIQDWPPDLILLDLRTPVMNGWEFARAYHDSPGPHAPIVVIAAVNDTGDVLSSVSAQDMLPKPFELEELLQVVSQHVCHALPYGIRPDTQV